ncbi:MAG: SNF2 family N-terminal domain-containing protein [Benniella sp.]|nr:MAG: SNF2 family N-terminal domain-containing protein [Benniella sp.]
MDSHLGQLSGSGGRSNNSSSSSSNGSARLTDALGFASRFFQQIGNTSLNDDDDDYDEDDDRSMDESDDKDGSLSPASTATAGLEAAHTVVKNKLSDTVDPSDQDHRSKRTRLEAVVNLINSGVPDLVAQPVAPSRPAEKDRKRMITPSELVHFNFYPTDTSTSKASFKEPSHTQHQRQQQQKQQKPQQRHQQQQPPLPSQHLLASTELNSMHRSHSARNQPSYQLQQALALPLPSQLLSKVQGSDQDGTPDRPLSVVSSNSSITSATSVSPTPPSPTPRIKTERVIDLTEEEATAISDDEVIIDESRTTTVANRNMCFGMIQSLVVTLYPRNLEYIEGKADRVIMKRSTTANKASLAVEHEAGLYGYIVSELAETLVPLVDANMIWWEAHVPRQKKQNNVSAPINIVLYGRPEYQMAVAKVLYGKVRLEEPVSFDHRTQYSNPLVPAPGETLSPYDKWRGAIDPVFSGGSERFYSQSGYSYAGYSGSSVRSAEEIKNQIDGVFKGLRSATDLPQVEPASMIASTMYRHQKQALYFLMEREKQEDYSDNEKNKLTSLWRVRQQLHRHPTYLNVVTNQETSLKPTSMRGGILADDMGLGKTITVISLITSTLDRGMHAPQRANKATSLPSTSAAPDFLNSGDLVTEYDTPPSPTIRPLLPTAPKKPLHRKKATNARTKSHGTLIVCPLSTVQNWEEQFETHVRKDSLQIYVYHGGQRVSDPGYLAKHDVVITTYNLLGTEYSKECKGRDGETGPSKQPSALQQIDWFRVVLDEAHIIKEVSTVQSKAACALTAERRWCLTGTPVQNKLDDLYALVKFLKMQPFDEKAHWMHYIAKPIKAANPIGISRLQALMKVITLRRTKTQMVDGKPLLDLPPRTDHMRVLDLSLNERQLYQRMESNAKQTVDKIVQEDKIMKNYAHILQAILKLRQICAHYALVKNVGDDLDVSEDFNEAKASAILTLLRDSGNDQCNHCFNTSTQTPIVTRCEHLFCPDCVKKLSPISFMLIQKGNANVSVSPELKTDFGCPQCATILRPVDLIQIPDDTEDNVAATAAGTTESGHLHARMDENGMVIHSTKVKALVEDLQREGEVSRRTGKPLMKSVVFSQWTSMLDLIEDGLRENHIRFTRLDGTMQRHDRTTAMMRFKERPEVSVILISLKAGGVGLNLTSAQRVYLMDPHWNPSVESQAVDRIHRLGQTKPVDVVRFIIKESIEENILELQKRKTELSEMTFAEKVSKQEVMKRRLEDLRYLFQGSSELMKKKAGNNSSASTPTLASTEASASASTETGTGTEGKELEIKRESTL